MLSVRLDNETQKKLDNLARITRRPKSFFVKDALSAYLDEMSDFVEREKNNPLKSPKYWSDKAIDAEVKKRSKACAEGAEMLDFPQGVAHIREKLTDQL